MKIYLLIIPVLLNALICKGQSTDCPVRVTQSEVSYKNYFSSSWMIRLNYLTMENQTSEDFYFWIGRVVSDGLDPEQLFLAYFYGKRAIDHETLFGDIVTATSGSMDGYGIKEIGYTFIKLLKPGEKFTVIMPTDQRKVEFFRKRFVFMAKSVLERKVGTLIEKFYTCHRYWIYGLVNALHS